MHHARRLYKTAPKKQHRQMMCPTIPGVGYKKLKVKKSYDAGYQRPMPELRHEQEQRVPGGPVRENESRFLRSIRSAKEVRRRPSPPESNGR